MHGRRCLALVALLLMLGLGRPVLADEAAPPAPLRAADLLTVALEAYGDRQGLDPEYGEVNQQLLETLRTAIALVDASAPATPDPDLAGALSRWRAANRHLVGQLAKSASDLPHPGDDPLRYRIAQQRLYDQLVAGLRQNLAAFRRLARAW